MTDTPASPDYEWTPMAPDAPFPERMQGRWCWDDGSTALIVEGRRLIYGDQDLKVGTLSIIDREDGFAVNNEGPNGIKDGWGEETLHVLWFNPGEDELNFHGIGDHGWANRAEPAEGEIEC